MIRFSFSAEVRIEASSLIAQPLTSIHCPSNKGVFGKLNTGIIALRN